MSKQSELAEQIGGLLIRTGSLTPDLLADAVKIAELTNVSLERVLETNGYLSEAGVNAALEIQALVESDQLKLEEAVEVMHSVARRGVDLHTAVRQLHQGRYVAIDKSEHSLGQMLALSGAISEEHFKSGLYDSMNTGLPLGMVLVEKEILLPDVLEWCLTAQSMVNQGTLRVEDAAHAVRVARLERLDLKQSLQRLRLPTNGSVNEFGLGDLLVMANSLTTTQLLAVREFCLVRQKDLNEVLEDLGMVSEEVINASEQLLIMISEQVLSRDQAAIIVRKLCRCSDIEEMVAILSNIQEEVEKQNEPVQILDLVASCRLVSVEQLAAGMMESRKRNSTILQTLIDTNVISSETMQAVNACKKVVDSGVIELEQGLIALSCAVDNHQSFAAALASLGWHHQASAV